MTPLQPIIAFANILKKRLVELYAQKMNIEIERPLSDMSYLNQILKEIVNNSQEA